MPFLIAHNCHAAAVRSHYIALRNRVLSVVPAFSVHVRPNGQQQLCHRRLIKNRNQIYNCQRANNLGALILGNHGSALAFQEPCLRIGIHRHDKQIAQCFCALKVAYMTHVQDVEAAIRQDDAGALPTRLRDGSDQLFAIEDTPRIEFGAQLFSAVNRRGRIYEGLRVSSRCPSKSLLPSLTVGLLTLML